MSLILSGTDGLSDVDGSAATPAIRGTDANTGIFFPAADTIAFSEGGVESMRIDSSGNVGIGTGGPRTQMMVLGAGQTTAAITDSGNQGGTLTLAQNSSSASSGGALLFAALNNNSTYVPQWAIKGLLENGSSNGIGSLAFSSRALVGDTALTERMRIDSSGNVGIGTNSPAGKLDITSGTARMYFSNQSATAFFTAVNTANSAYAPMAINGSELILKTGDSERMRIDSSGQVGIGMAGAGSVRLSVASGTSYIMVGRNSAGSTDQFRIEADGDVENVNNVYRAISDVKIKENITDATPKLKKLCQVRVVSYNLKDGLGYGTHKQIGVVAQELEPIFPGMVEESPDYEEVTTTDEDGNETTERVATGTTTKSVKYSVFVPMLIKAIQEQQDIIQTLTDRITALEAK